MAATIELQEPWLTETGWTQLTFPGQSHPGAPLSTKWRAASYAVSHAGRHSLWWH